MSTCFHVYVYISILLKSLEGIRIEIKSILYCIDVFDDHCRLTMCNVHRINPYTYSFLKYSFFIIFLKVKPDALGCGTVVFHKLGLFLKQIDGFEQMC